MPASYNQMPERRANLALAFEELLTAIVRLRSGRNRVSDEQSFRANSEAAVDSAIQQGNAMGYAAGHVRMAAYAVVAFLDESVLNLRSPVFTSWIGHPLQQKYSSEDVAGEKFFRFLQQLKDEPNSMEVADILEVFCLCIFLGYGGRYGSAGSGELSAIVRTAQEKILRSRGGTAFLSPWAQLPRDLPEPKAPDRWSKRLTWTVASAAALSVVVFIVCKLVLINGAAQLQSLAGH